MKPFYQILRFSLVFLFLFSSVGKTPVFAQHGPTPPGPAAPEVDEDVSATKRTYLPMIARTGTSNAAAIDLSMDSVEITQAVQTATNSVPLIAGKPTALRVYAKTSNGSSASNVRVSVRAVRNGSNLSESPLTTAARTLTRTSERGNLNSSYNIPLPSSWLSGRVTLTVTLDSENAVNENNESNNVFTLSPTFLTASTLNVKVVPITYDDPDTGRIYDPMTSYTWLDTTLIRLYPIASITRTVRQTGITVTCDLDASSCWSSTLDRITDLRISDNASATQVYYGVVPIEDPDYSTPWFSSGYAGIGWLGYRRASLGLGDSIDWGLDGGMIAAHEIGHNMGRDHAPCGVSGDSSYPYSGGLIGQFGLSLNPLRLYSPTGTYAYSDVMGYCDRQWISDYTYNAIRAELSSTSAQNEVAVPGLLVRTRFDGDAPSEFAPTYVFSGFPSPADPASQWAVEFLDAAGEIVARQTVDLLRAEEPGITAQSINSLVPLPSLPFTAYRVVNGTGTVLEKKVAASASAPDVQADPAGLNISGDNLTLAWGAPGTPTLVRYTSDGGLTWTTVAIDATEGSLSISRNSLPQGTIRFEIIPAGELVEATSLEWQNIP